MIMVKLNTGEIRKLVKNALKIRYQNGIPLNNSFCVIDLVDKLGLEVKFVSISSMEGAFLKESKTILLSTLRPEGRIRFTCAHELGHFIFNHGDHFDELVEEVHSGKSRYEESLADMFASFLLMPETTVRNGFVSRGWDINKPSYTEIYTIANYLGVGYSTLLKHMRYGLNMLNTDEYDMLIKKQPKDIKSELCGRNIITNLLVIDKFWKGRPADMQVGDYLIIDGIVSIEGDCVELINEKTKSIVVAQKSGICRLMSDNFEMPIVIRVRKKEYTGRAIFRHLEED
jgi:Zn-dependent peptidase ImmA (M78 family)